MLLRCFLRAGFCSLSAPREGPVGVISFPRNRRRAGHTLCDDIGRAEDHMPQGALLRARKERHPLPSKETTALVEKARLMAPVTEPPAPQPVSVCSEVAVPFLAHVSAANTCGTHDVSHPRSVLPKSRLCSFQNAAGLYSGPGDITTKPPLQWDQKG